MVEVLMYVFFVLLGWLARHLWERHKVRRKMPTFSWKDGWVGEGLEKDEFERFKEASESGEPAEIVGTYPVRCPLHGRLWCETYPVRYCGYYVYHTREHIRCPQPE